MHEAGLIDAVGRISNGCEYSRHPFRSVPSGEEHPMPKLKRSLQRSSSVRKSALLAGRDLGGFLFGKFGSAPVGRGRQLLSRGSLPRGGVECLAAHRVGCRRRGSFNWVPTAGCIGCMMLGRPTSAEHIPSIPGEERRRAGFEPSTGSANNPTLCGQDRMWRLTCIEHASGSGATKKQSSGSSPASVGSRSRSTG